MWAEFRKILPTFPSAVLTGFDSTGYPVSIRCQPQIDEQAQALLLTIPATVDLQAGPVSLLVHSHNEKLWNLRSYLVRGQLQRQGTASRLLVEKLTPGAGMGGLRATLAMISNARRNTTKYLQKRNLSRPVIPWAKLATCKPDRSAG